MPLQDILIFGVFADNKVMGEEATPGYSSSPPPPPPRPL